MCTHETVGGVTDLQGRGSRGSLWSEEAKECTLRFLKDFEDSFLLCNMSHRPAWKKLLKRWDISGLLGHQQLAELFTWLTPGLMYSKDVNMECFQRGCQSVHSLFLPPLPWSPPPRTGTAELGLSVPSPAAAVWVRRSLKEVDRSKKCLRAFSPRDRDPEYPSCCVCILKGILRGESPAHNHQPPAAQAPPAQAPPAQEELLPPSSSFPSHAPPPPSSSPAPPPPAPPPPPPPPPLSAALSNSIHPPPLYEGSVASSLSWGSKRRQASLSHFLTSPRRYNEAFGHNPDYSPRPVGVQSEEPLEKRQVSSYLSTHLRWNCPLLEALRFPPTPSTIPPACLWLCWVGFVFCWVDERAL